MPKRINNRDKQNQKSRACFPGPTMPFQILIHQRTAELNMSGRELHRTVNSYLDPGDQIKLSTFWEWTNRSNKRAGMIKPAQLKAIAKAIQVDEALLAKQWDLSRLHFTTGTIPEPIEQKSGLELLIITLENDKRIYIKRTTLLELAKRLLKGS